MSARTSGSRSPSDQCLEHRPAGLAEDVAGHRRPLDHAVLEELLDALLVPGTVLHELGPKARVVTKVADLGWRHEGRPEHPTLVQLRQPDRVKLVRFGPTGHVLYVPGVHEPDAEPARFEQVEERPPVVRGGLEHDALDLELGKIVGEGTSARLIYGLVTKKTSA
jgi:hypothetical protein